MTQMNSEIPPERLFSLDEIRRVLKHTPAALTALIAGAPAAAIEYQEADGAWTPRQVLCHVTDGEVTDWLPRIGLILSPGELKTFAPFDREAGFQKYAGWSAQGLLEEFRRLREHNLAQLDAFNLTQGDLSRTGRHPALGTVTLEQLLACWATHDVAHVAQISRSLVRYLGPLVGPWQAFFSLLAKT